MDTVIKISTDYDTIEAQFINLSGLSYKEELKNVGEMKFTIPLSDPQAALIKEYKKVELYIIENSDDVFVWSGFVMQLEYNFNDLIVTCGDEKRFMQKKIIYADKSWATKTVSFVLNELVTDANTRSGGIKGNLSYETSLTSSISKDFKEGTTYYRIIQEIADLLDAEWRVEKNKIIFESTIGEDKTSGADFVEFVSSKLSPNENNITRFTIRRDGNRISTAVIGKAGTSKSQQSSNTDEFGFVESSTSFSEGDVVDQTTQYLNEHKVSQKEIDIDIDSSDFDFRNLNIGDLVKLRIDRELDFIDTDESLKIISKSIRFVNKKPVIAVKLAEVAREVFDTSNFLAGVDDRLKALELQ